MVWCMVGTAVYQVGLGLVHPAEELQSVESRRAKDLAASRKRGQQAGHQPVNVKERHDVEPAVLRNQTECGPNAPGRGDDVALG